MSFLLDTNVVSEWAKPQPNPTVIGWMNEVDEDRVFLSVVTLTELRYGVERLPAGKKRQRLEGWLQHELPLRFQKRILGIDEVVANACGKLLTLGEAIGRPFEAMDGFIAATAEVHDLTLVTRNDSHFTSTVRSILNPWT